MRRLGAMVVLGALACGGGPEQPPPPPRPAASAEPVPSEPVMPEAPAFDGLCEPGEHEVVFSCRLEDGRVASVCASSDLDAESGTMQYRFGRPGAVELAWPEPAVHPRGRFTMQSATGGPRIHQTMVWFDNQDVRYTLLDAYFHGSQDNELRVLLADGTEHVHTCAQVRHPAREAPDWTWPVIEDESVTALLKRVGRVEEDLRSGCIAAEERPIAERWLAEAREVDSAIGIWRLEQEVEPPFACD